LTTASQPDAGFASCYKECIAAEVIAAGTLAEMPGLFAHNPHVC